LTEYIIIITVLKNQTRTREIEKKHTPTQSPNKISITKILIKESQGITHMMPRSDVKKVIKEITRFNLPEKLKFLVNIFRIL
jgi:predicted Fe-Mo cluster-binding NifX family protein